MCKIDTVPITKIDLKPALAKQWKSVFVSELKLVRTISEVISLLQYTSNYYSSQSAFDKCQSRVVTGNEIET